MPDMLVRLYSLPDVHAALDRAAAAGVVVSPPEGADLSPLRAWVEQHFGPRWSDGVTIALARQPMCTRIARRSGEIVGFALWDVSLRMWFGPMGVREDLRGNGIGTALLLDALRAMRGAGYGYAIIGDVGPIEFYEKVAAATLIPDSDWHPRHRQSSDR